MADVLRIKRRPVGGAAGAPGSLAPAEIAYNEVDDTFWYGKGDNGAGASTSRIPIGGAGAFLPLSGGQMTGAIQVVQSTNPLVISKIPNPAPSQGYLGGSLLQVFSDAGANPRIAIDAYGNGSPAFSGRSAGGTYLAPTATQVDQAFINLNGFGYGVGGFSAQARVTITLRAAQAWTDTAQGTYIALFTTPNGTAAQVERMRLTDQGALQFNTTGPLITTGAGAPAIVAPVASLFLRNDGAAGSQIYVNTNGTSAGWQTLPVGGPFLPLAGGGPLTGPVFAVTGTNPFTINANTVTPTQASTGAGVLRVVGANAQDAGVVGDTYGTAGAGGRFFIMGRAAQGSATVPAAVIANQTMLHLRGVGFGQSAYGGARATIALTAAENYTDTAQGAYIQFTTTAVGGTTTLERLRITDAGALQFNITGPSIQSGAGAPLASAPVASLFLRSDGTPGSQIYVNQDGATSWAPLVTGGPFLPIAGGTVGPLTVSGSLGVTSNLTVTGQTTLTGPTTLVNNLVQMGSGNTPVDITMLNTGSGGSNVRFNLAGAPSVFSFVFGGGPGFRVSSVGGVPANYFWLNASAAGAGFATIAVTGADANVELRLIAQGTGTVHLFSPLQMDTNQDLTLARDPTLPLHAATRQWVLANAPAGLAVLDTITALRAQTTTAAAIYVRGYYASGDGGGGDYVRGANGTDNSGTVIQTANGTYYLQTYGQPLSVRQTGAKGTGLPADNDTTACQRALDQSLNVVFPGGTYFLGGALIGRIGHTIRGCGIGATTLLQMAGGSYTIVFQSASHILGNVTVSDLTIRCGASNCRGISSVLYSNVSLLNLQFAGCEGMAVHIDGGYFILLDNCISVPTLQGGTFKAGGFEAVSATLTSDYCFYPTLRDCKVHTIEYESGTSQAVGVNGPCVNFNRVIGGLIENFVAERLELPTANSVIGIQIAGDSQGVKIIGGVTFGASYGVVLFPDGGSSVGPSYLVVQNHDIDAFYVAGVSVNGTPSKVCVDIVISDCLITAAQLASSISITVSQVLRLIIKDNILQQYQSPQTGDGIQISATNMTLISGNILTDHRSAFGMVPTCVNTQFTNNMLVGNLNNLGPGSDMSASNTGTNMIKDNTGAYSWSLPYSTPPVPPKNAYITNTTGMDVDVYIRDGVDVVPGVNGIGLGVVYNLGGADPTYTGSLHVPANGSIGFSYTTAPTWKWVPV